MKSSINTVAFERGILSSVYKQEIKSNIRSIRSQSLSRVKNRLKRDSEKIYSETGTFLKVAMFMVIIVSVIF